MKNIRTQIVNFVKKNALKLKVYFFVRRFVKHYEKYNVLFCAKDQVSKLDKDTCRTINFTSRVKVNFELLQDIAKHHNIDVEGELIQLMKEQIGLEILSKITQSLDKKSVKTSDDLINLIRNDKNVYIVSSELMCLIEHKCKDFTWVKDQVSCPFKHLRIVGKFSELGNSLLVVDPCLPVKYACVFNTDFQMYTELSFVNNEFIVNVTFNDQDCFLYEIENDSDLKK